ncbi:MAG: hypothetical protein N5P05_003290 [Chroococcopsis gigantea SAG 12.99]|jgi:biofilm PGA synthesis lipoprotein PgaB|nr:polysaccharide deacetylase family protein [Chlorogloea purpurea SAG 13.99]MDV3001684.1 hypothetical protein [Chroococcopsis gigantea SAG 12.99]
MFGLPLRKRYKNSLLLLIGLLFLALAIVLFSSTGQKSSVSASNYFPRAFTEVAPRCERMTLPQVRSFKDNSAISCEIQSSNKVIPALAWQRQDITLDGWDNNGTEVQLAPWPELHPNAKTARVPVLMYHDILPEKQVFFDVTPEELEAHFQSMKEQGVTPISLDWLISHLRTGIPLPEKPVLLTFDDGYGGHYQYVYPLLKKYEYPAVFSIYIKKMEMTTGRSSVTWEQLREMSADPLVTIVSHSVTHPRDLRTLSDEDLKKEIFDSKQILEKELAIKVPYFTYPEGKADDRVKGVVTEAGYRAALSMNDADEHFAGESTDLLTIGRFGQSRTARIIPQAFGGQPLPREDGGFNFATPIHKYEVKFPNNTLVLISGGIPRTIHANSRYQVPEIIAGTGAVGAVDGAFFSLKSLDSNVMIGPVLSQNGGFVPGYKGEIGKLTNRPLVLLSDRWVRYVPFDPEKHNTLEGINAESLDGATVTDAFVAAAWLVRDGKPQPAETFNNLYTFDVARHRAFWGINMAGQPVVGVSREPVDSVALGELLYEAGFRDAVMLDSGASTSLAYQDQSLVAYTPRPVPHVVALFPPLSPTLLQVSHVGNPCVIYEDSCGNG